MWSKHVRTQSVFCTESRSCFSKTRADLLIWGQAVDNCGPRHRGPPGTDFIHTNQAANMTVSLLMTCLLKVSDELVLPILAGLHGHHISPPALDGWALGVWGQQEPEPRRAPGGASLGAGHFYCWLQKILPAWYHRGEQTDPHLPQWDRPLCSEVG